MKNFCLLVLSAFCSFSCDQRTCFNENPVFDKFEPQNQEYRAELAKVMGKNPEASFAIYDYKIGERVDTLYVKISGDEVCAMGLAQVAKDNEVLSGVREKQAGGYRGAGLLGAQFKIVGNDLILEDVDWILD